MKAALVHHLQAELSRIDNSMVQITGYQQVFGGDINTTYVLSSGEKRYFVKLNTAACADMLSKEQDGLVLLRTAKTSLKIPRPILQGTAAQQHFLLMEYLEKGTESSPLWEQLAMGLVQLHQTTQDRFGLHYDNYVGTVAQSNTTADTWAEFYTGQRIMPLIRQAFNRHKCAVADIQLAEQFCKKLDTLMPEEPPALLHGDLWSGNRMFTTAGEAAIYDPAVYFGHREMDIAMTLLFGGFDTPFYTTYNDIYPLQQGWRNRITICQLYPLLVHLILFGGHYYHSVRKILKQFA